MREPFKKLCRAFRFPSGGKILRVIFHPVEIAVLSVLLLANARAAEPEIFAKAETAYKAGKFDEAAVAYDGILASGKFAPEISFNLGNVKYRQGKIGEAVLNYRRAWMLAPRDPDILANLHFALQRANAPGPMRRRFSPASRGRRSRTS